MRKKRSFLSYFFLFVIIFLVALIIMTFMVMGRVNILSREAEKIANMEMGVDELDSNIYSVGRYAVVEATMKNYIRSYIETSEHYMGIKNDETLLAMLGNDNLMSDGPEFAKSKAYIESRRKEIESLRQKLISMGTEQSIRAVFEEKGMNAFFNWIYRNQMLGNIGLDFYYPASQIEAAAAGLNEILDKKEAVLDFLASHKDQWHFDDNMIEFTDEDLLAEYTKLIDAL